jgi:hypothetical protein
MTSLTTSPPSSAIVSSLEGSSNEPINTNGDGNTDPDIEIVDAIMCGCAPNDQATAMDESTQSQSQSLVGTTRKTPRGPL